MLLAESSEQVIQVNNYVGYRSSQNLNPDSCAVQLPITPGTSVIENLLIPVLLVVCVNIYRF